MVEYTLLWWAEQAARNLRVELVRMAQVTYSFGDSARRNANVTITSFDKELKFVLGSIEKSSGSNKATQRL